MAVYLNYKICDNADECSGIEVCPTGALFWNAEDLTLATDNFKCISCDACIEACPAGAILVAHDDNEATEIESDIANDPRTLEELMVERYGASPVEEAILIKIDQAIRKVKEITSLLVIEVIDNDDAPCLINSVPITEIFGNRQFDYYKVSVDDVDYDFFATTYGIGECPALLVFNNHEIIVQMEGAVDNGNQQQRMDFIQKINSMI